MARIESTLRNLHCFSVRFIIDFLRQGLKACIYLPKEIFVLYLFTQRKKVYLFTRGETMCCILCGESAQFYFWIFLCV